MKLRYQNLNDLMLVGQLLVRQVSIVGVEGGRGGAPPSTRATKWRRVGHSRVVARGRGTL